MPIAFDPATRRIILDSATVSAVELWSRWCDWAVLSDNLKWLQAMRYVGGDELNAGRAIPPYVFLMNGWRVRPMEANHVLTIDGNLFVDASEDNPVVQTLGNFNVLVDRTVPVQAQALIIGGSSGGPSASAIATAVWSKLFANGKTAEATLTQAQLKAALAAVLSA